MKHLLEYTPSIKKGAIRIFLIVFLLVCFSVSAFAIDYRYIDNDCLPSTGYTNNNWGNYVYITGSNHQNGDARRKPCGTSGFRYEYDFTSSSVYRTGSFKVVFETYLNDNSFSDPAAIYKINYGGTLPGSFTWSLDQDSAAGGVNTVFNGYVGQYPTLNYSIISMEVRTSGSGSNLATGADQMWLAVY